MNSLIPDRKILLACFYAMAAIQLAVPVVMIARHEIVLDSGTVYKFRTAPVDPYDAFRGKYVALRFESTEAPCDSPSSLRHGQRVYATVKVNPDGFAGFSNVADTPPSEGDYIGVEFGSAQGKGTCIFRLPFDRFYLEEGMAPEAERLYNEHSRGTRDAWAMVRVKSGKAVIEDLYVGGKPVKDLIREIRTSGK